MGLGRMCEVSIGHWVSVFAMKIVWTVCKMSLFVWITEIHLFIFDHICSAQHPSERIFESNANGITLTCDQMRSAGFVEIVCLMNLIGCALVFGERLLFAFKNTPWFWIIIPSIIWQVWHRLFNGNMCLLRWFEPCFMCISPGI